MSLDNQVEVPADFHRIGLLTWRDGQPVQVPFFARLLEPAALAEVQDIHQEALRRLSEPGLVRTDSDAFFAHHFRGEGRILGAFAENRLIAYGILSLPAGPDYRYDRFLEDLDLPASEWPRMAQLIGVAVRPEWRGNSLHRRLCEWRLELAHAVHRWQVAAVSAPANPCSWRNLLAVGLRVTNIKMLGGDKLRYLLHADLRGAPSLDPTTTVTCAVSDMAEQQALLARGYRGYAAVMEQNVLHIRYARPLPP